MTIEASTVERRLDLLESRGDIAALVHQYAFNIRSARVADCVHLFTEDVVFENRRARLGDTANARTVSSKSGRDTVLAYLAPNGGKVCPVIQNILIDVRGDEADSTCVMFNADPGGTPVFGEYHDHFRREDTWRFASRTFVMFVPAGEPL